MLPAYVRQCSICQIFAYLIRSQCASAVPVILNFEPVTFKTSSVRDAAVRTICASFDLILVSRVRKIYTAIAGRPCP